jgi:archaemetzincin
MYNVDVIVLPNRDLPFSCYYKPNHRYRAEKLLGFLNEDTDEKYLKVVGLTSWDISVTKGKLYDGPVSGFGFIGKRPCIASTYRLGGDKISSALLVSRLIKIVNHELGHTFGLSHCAEQGCLMEDKGGTIRTVDSESGILCDECAEALGDMLLKDYDAKLPRLHAVSQTKR